MTAFRRNAPIALLAGALTIWIAPGAAWAGTASVEAGPQIVHYDATSGQNNVVDIEPVSAQTVTITDFSATPVAGAGCHVVNSTTVSCTAPNAITLVFVGGGDQSDRIDASNLTIPVEFIGGSGNDVLTGGSGSDLLDGGMGSDNMTGGGGGDHLISADCSDLIDAGPGDDLIDLGGGNALALGGPGNDIFRPMPTICALGNDVFGGADNDTFDASGATGWPANVPALISLDDVSNDGPVSGERWNVHGDMELVLGGPEDDVIVGRPGSQLIDGGAGNDTIDGGPQADTLNGGPGEDTIDYSNRTAPVKVDLRGFISNNVETGAPSVANGENFENDSILGFEDVRGGAAADFLIGNSANNVFDGGGGGDLIVGGPGLDVADYSRRTAPVFADLDGQAADDGEAGEGDTLRSDIEGIIGGAAGDTLTGNASDGLLYGGAGDDHLTDPGGRDTIRGEAGNDVIGAVDNAIDTISCGTELDTVNADNTDAVDGDCETVNRTATPPAVPDTALGPHPKRFFRTKTPTFTFSSNVPGSTFRCRVDGDADAPCSSPFTTRPLSEGLHVFTVTAVSPTGIADPRPYEFNFRVDTRKPSLTVKLGGSHCVGATPLRIAIHSSDVNKIARTRVKLGSKTLKSGRFTSARVFVSRAQYRRYGRRLRVSATDQAGNTRSKSLRLMRCL